MGKINLPFHSFVSPLAWLIGMLGKNLPNENLPRVTITRGFIVDIWESREVLQEFISVFCGSLFFGGLHLTMLVMYTSCFLRPIESNKSSSSEPALPMKGSPILSSLNPGASPMNMISAFGLPLPGTVLVRSFDKLQAKQLEI